MSSQGSQEPPYPAWKLQARPYGWWHWLRNIDHLAISSVFLWEQEDG